MHLTTTHLLLLLPAALAAHIRLALPPQTQLPNPSLLPPSTTASLTTLGRIYSSPLRTDNTFDFRNITTGSYLLDIHAHTHAFAPLRVDVSLSSSNSANPADKESWSEKVEVWGTFRGNEWENKGEVVQVAEMKEGGKTIKVFDGRALGGKEYLLGRTGFSPLGLLKSPMILIAGASMLLVFGMPYLMENMDPEMKAEFEERQKSSPLSGGPAANPLQNFDAAAWLAGSSGSGTSTPKRATGAEKEKGISR